MFKIKRFSFLILLLTVVLTSCSTKKNTSLSRTYHNLTARYNILFNGEESFKKGMLNLETTYKDDFTELIPVFLYSNKEAIASIGSDMDRAIKKAEKLISNHSITAKPELKTDKELTAKQKEYLAVKEYNLYVDDAYLLMGKSLIYIPDLAKAKETFNFVISNFSDTKAAFEARLWLARIAIVETKFREADDYLLSLSQNIALPSNLIGEVNATRSEYYIQLKKYDEAIEPLIKSIEHTRHKYTRSRYTYLVAQLYSKTNNEVMASGYYDKVIKMNPGYEMAFNAKINRALTYQSGVGSRKDIEKQLFKMLKDDKNIDFQDQIYYALGNLYFKDKNNIKAIEYYKLSAKSSKDNMRQKAKTSLTLADLYYSQPDYVNAQAYYDSTVAIIDQDYPNYQLIYAKSISLTKLVEAINIVNTNDSLLALSTMSKSDLDIQIDKWIENERRIDEDKKQKALELAEANNTNIETGVAGISTGNDWYFYNPTAKNIGHKEFLRVWGPRKLEDNWRRKNKASVAFSDGGITENQGSENETGEKQSLGLATNKKSKEYYVQNIPYSDSAKSTAHQQIASALFVMGNVYADELKDNDKAIYTFEDLLKRYPNTETRLQVYYKIYLLAKQMEDIERTSNYQQKIIKEFPSSNFAKLMTNPNYLKEFGEQEKQVVNYYNLTYSYFLEDNFAEVVIRSEQAMREYPDHELYPKYSYLHTLSAGKQKDTLSFLMDLQSYILKYPNTEMAENAQHLVYYLQQKQPKIIEIQQQVEARNIYISSFNEPHQFLFIINSGVNLNQLIFNIINYNLDNFDKLKLQVKKVSIDGGKTNLCVVSKFRTGSEALDYYSSITRNKEIYKDIEVSNIEAVIISETNYKALNETGKLKEYSAFFKEFYDAE